MGRAGAAPRREPWGASRGAIPAATVGFVIHGGNLVMNFNIGVASAKAFRMVPFLAVMAELTHQSAVLFRFGPL